jgi:DNA-directed RNA polymerase specialized sigma24 family protein
MKRVTDAEAHEWREQYEAGATIEELALEHGRSTPTVAKHLHKVGTEMRPALPPKGRRKIPQRHDGQLDPTARIVRPSMARWMR